MIRVIASGADLPSFDNNAFVNSQYLSPQRIRLCPTLELASEGLILCDARLLALYPQLFDKKMAIYYVQANEATKNWDTLAGIYQFFAEHNFKRSEQIQVLGGGITCDIAAFAAATFKRGCRLKLYPSTLLAMVDAALGGKCAINHLQQRNLLGTFYPAEEICIYPKFLNSLPNEELRQGKAEMLKSYLLLPELSAVNLDENSVPAAAQIMEYASFKMQLCAQDPYDKGIRRLLNFGHTYGHAYETLLDYRYKHGDSVVMGMLSEIEFSYKKAYLPEVDFLKIKELLDSYPLPEGIVQEVQALAPDDLAKAIGQDKKQGGKMPLATGFRKVELL